MTLPSRVIDVRPVVPFLRETAQGEKGTYITLSHCWGDSSIPKTTLSTLEGRKRQIPLEGLPKSFQDAIKIARSLNIPYLWIDSLCIIQEGDNGADMQREIARMGNTYQLSVLTIAAGGSLNSTGGCFLPRKSRPAGPFVQMPYRTVDGVIAGYFYVQERHSSFNEEYEKYVRNCPLFARGWVLQERLLSRRVIIYTEGQIFFECQTNLPINECGEIYRRYNKTAEDLKKEPEPMDKAILRQNDTRMISPWYSVVELYSAMKLSQPLDRLIAISGIAQELQLTMAAEAVSEGKESLEVKRETRYVSGLWLKDLPSALLWQCTVPNNATSSGCGIPSWSWASLLEGVVWRKEMFTGKRACEIISPEPVENPWWQRKLSLAKKMAYENLFAQYKYIRESDVSKDFVLLPDTHPLETWSPDHIVRKLEIRGQIRSVLRSGCPLAAADAILFAIWTGHWRDSERQVPDAKPSEYFGICGNDEYQEDNVAGWGSFERHIHSGLPTAANGSSQLESVSAPYMVYCLLVSTRSEDGGLDFGYAGSKHKVCNVLYLARRSGDEEVYERVGVGMIFEKDFFKASETKHITLV